MSIPTLLSVKVNRGESSLEWGEVQGRVTYLSTNPSNSSCCSLMESSGSR